MMTAAHSIGRYDARRGTLDMWLLGLARHQLARFCRKRRKEIVLVPDVGASDASSEVRVAEMQADEALERDLVNRALASLPERQATVLIGTYVSGHSVEELANHMASTPKAVESLLSRARVGFRMAFTALLGDGRGGDGRG
jgi:RNA polymerase sigma-70 factor (ECF subfamily)